MTHELYAQMLEWLATGTEIQQRHARFRLAQPDAEPYAKPDGWTPPEMPPLMTQAANFVGAMVDFARSGFALATDAEQARRLAICEACEKYDAGQSRCTACGCFVQLKTRIESGSCPIGKW